MITHPYALAPRWHPISTLTHPEASAPLPLSILMLPMHSNDMPPTLPPHIQPYPSLCFCHPASSSPQLTMHTTPLRNHNIPPMLPPHVRHHQCFPPTGPSRYVSNAATQFPPSPILTLPHTCCFP
ncbi:hypothetical protein O181_088416 [Austropuccinia psidii MF-1]|uniref:Uncharacterized protein n=1 Tax=Austropuccinia psidii MF-1 TaxID=1389203 RepID=A0A9Q3IRK5_9BASI|nr:hypothetical protein [Austropuccinia psidii MF-1]